MKRHVKKNRRSLVRAFGIDEYGQIELPPKISGTTISRLLKGEWMGCSYCFPHRWEVINAKWKKDLSCWKRYRKHQWRER